MGMIRIISAICLMVLLQGCGGAPLVDEEMVLRNWDARRRVQGNITGAPSWRRICVEADCDALEEDATLGTAVYPWEAVHRSSDGACLDQDTLEWGACPGALDTWTGSNEVLP